ncbi:hypothetical protein GZH46_00623, partial [Fragariocoptes setiger]
MLSVMGGLLTIKSLAFIEDLAIEEFNTGESIDQFYKEQDHRYDSAANNCWIALAMYGLTFVVSAYHWVAFSKRGLV